MDSKEKIGTTILEVLEAGEARLQAEADRHKARLDEELKLKAKAGKELPGLEKKLVEKGRELRKVEEEIRDLEGEIAQAEVWNSALGNDRIARTRRDYEQAQYRADTFVKKRTEQLTTLIHTDGK